MAEEEQVPKKMSMTNTKQELLRAYNAALNQLREKRESELRPEKRAEEKKATEVVKESESLSAEAVVKETGNLKIEIGKMLTQISDRLEQEVNKFKNIQQAIEIKENEFQELYGIEKSALTFATMIEAQDRKRQEFESEMAAKKLDLDQEIEGTRAEWDKEKWEREAKIKERDVEEKKRREREKEEFTYSFKREKRLAEDKFADEKAKTEKEIRLNKERMEKELAERERTLAEAEKELNELRSKVNAFPQDMETAVNKAIKETTERMTLAAKNREALLEKEYDGERNVLTTRVASFEKTVKQQAEQIATLSQQSEKAYQKVQDTAIKAIEGASNLRSLSELQQALKEQAAKQPQDG